MKPTTINALRNRVENNKTARKVEGYVCIGRGGFPSISTNLDLSIYDLYAHRPDDDHFDSGYAGSDSTYLYYIKEDLYNKNCIVPLTNTKVDADSLMGKYVGFKKASGEVVSFRVNIIKVYTDQNANGPSTQSIVDRDGYCFCAGNDSGNTRYPIEMLTVSSSKELVLNGSYKAVISKGSVAVGCQTFTIEQVREIVRLHDSL